MKSQRFAKLLLVSLSIGFTAFVFLNTYEVVFNRDVVLANAIERFQAQDQIGAIINQFDVKPEDSYDQTNAEYKKLEHIQIPALSANLYLEEKRVINGNWYVRPSMGHYVGLDKDSHGTTVDYLIYATSGWQSIAAPNQIEEGMDVKLFHDGHSLAMYQVAEKKMLPNNTAYVPSKSKKRQIILIIEDPASKVYYGYSLVQKD